MKPFKKFLNTEGGAFTAIFAVMAPILIAGAGLAVDVSFWYSSKRDLQNAADAGALAGGYELLRTASQGFATDEAISAATRNVDGPSEITTEFPSSRRIRVTVEATSQTFFLGHFVDNPPIIRATALAEIDPDEPPKPPACLNLLGQNRTGEGLRINGNGRVEMGDGCGVQVNSNDERAVVINGDDARLISDDVCVSGGVFASSDYAISSVPRLNCPQIQNPYAHLESILEQMERSCPDSPRDTVGSPRDSRGGSTPQVTNQSYTSNTPQETNQSYTGTDVQVSTSSGGQVSSGVDSQASSNVSTQVSTGDPVSGGGQVAVSGGQASTGNSVSVGVVAAPGGSASGGTQVSATAAQTPTSNGQQTSNNGGQQTSNNGDQQTSNNGDQQTSNNGGQQTSNIGRQQTLNIGRQQTLNIGRQQTSNNRGQTTENILTFGAADIFGKELVIQTGVTVDLVGPEPIVMCFPLIVNSQATLNIRTSLIFANGASLIVRGGGNLKIEPPEPEVEPFEGLSIISSERNNAEHQINGGGHIVINGGRGISVPGDEIDINGGSGFLSTSLSLNAKFLRVGGNTTLRLLPPPAEQPLEPRSGDPGSVRLID
jgi:hypothetical protein